MIRVGVELTERGDILLFQFGPSQSGIDWERLGQSCSAFGLRGL